MTSNVRVVARERGKIVSVYEGHNIMTDIGRNNMARLVAWGTVDDTADVVESALRVRYLGLGSGYQPANQYVATLVSPVTYDGTLYLAELDSADTDFLYPGAVRFSRHYATNEISWSGPVVIQEMGLVMDRLPSGEADATQPDNEMAFYKVFPEGILKLDSFELDVTWDLRF